MSKITEYFKTTKNIEKQTEKDYRTESFASEFYDDCLKKKVCNNSECIKVTLEAELEDLQTKYDNIEEAIKIGMEIVAEKNVEIESLMKEVVAIRNRAVVSSPIQSENSISVQKSTDTVTVATAIESNYSRNGMFSSYELNFEKKQISVLRSIDSRKEVDSHFINTMVRSLYDGKLHVLQNKSVTGRSKPGQTKQAVTPEKQIILNGIYMERIKSSTTDCTEIAARKKKLNKYIKDAIHNICKSLDSKELEKETCRRLME